jgi:hypothetical protein
MDGQAYKPKQRGIYRTRTLGFTGYQYWNSRTWAVICTTPERAYRRRKEQSDFTSPDWQQITRNK